MTPALTEAFDWLVVEELIDAPRPLSALGMQELLRSRGVYCLAHDVRCAFVRLCELGLAEHAQPDSFDAVLRFAIRLELGN